ncbi:MAG: hypothetical protein ABNH21_19045 [Glaciecola sp.]|jgi:hypothetical protein
MRIFKINAYQLITESILFFALLLAFIFFTEEFGGHFYDSLIFIAAVWGGGLFVRFFYLQIPLLLLAKYWMIYKADNVVYDYLRETLLNTGSFLLLLLIGSYYFDPIKIFLNAESIAPVVLLTSAIIISSIVTGLVVSRLNNDVEP